MSGMWLFVTPIIAIIVVGVVLIAWYYVVSAVGGSNYTRGENLLADPLFVRLILIWAVSSVVITLVSSILVVMYLSKTLLMPLGELKKAADRIKAGELDFEIMTSRYEELNELCTAFESMRKRLQEMALIQGEYERERSELIANISHDLRTPITSIKGYAQGIMENVADTEEKRAKYVSTIYQKALALEELTNSMSDYAKYEMKRVTYDFQVTGLSDFLREFLDEYSLDLQDNGVEIFCDIPPDEMLVRLDKGKMRRVLANIISNAIKYRRGDLCTLQIRLDTLERGFCLSVADNGMGINSKDINRVFEGHFRGDVSRTSQVKGQGLGLSIAKQIVQAHKGKIWLKSEPDVGTDIHIYLPGQDDMETGQ